MTGIAGTAENRGPEVARMLQAIAHRGRTGRDVFAVSGATLGVVSSQPATEAPTDSAVQDAGPGGRLARAAVSAARLILERDALGLAPLYYGQTPDGVTCFGSEVKALLTVTDEVQELLPGQRWEAGAVTRAMSPEEPVERNCCTTGFSASISAGRGAWPGWAAPRCRRRRRRRRMTRSTSNDHTHPDR